MSEDLEQEESRKSPSELEEIYSKKRKPEDESNDDTHDKTIEDSFPASDPPSSIPDPEEDEDAA